MLKLFLHADRAALQTLARHLPPILDRIEALAADDRNDQLLAWSTPDPAGKEPAQSPAIGIVTSGVLKTSPDRLASLRARFPGRLAADSVFVLPPRTTDFLDFEGWCNSRVKAVLDYLLGEHVASQLAAAVLRRNTEQLERSLAQAETIFTEFRREPLKLAYRAERTGTYALPLPDESGPRLLEIRQTIHQQIANVRYIDIFFNSEGHNLEGTVRLTVKGAWSGKVLCDASVDVRDIRHGWTQFRCTPLGSGDEESLAVELNVAGSDLGWITPAFSHMSPVSNDCATMANYGPIWRPLAMQIWSGIFGIESPAHANAAGLPSYPGPSTVLGISPDQLGFAELLSALPPDLNFAPVAYDATTQSLLVHPLGHKRTTVARLPSLLVSNMTALSAIVQLTHPDAQPTEFALFALPASRRGPEPGLIGDDIPFSRIVWHELKGREWGEVEVTFPEPLDGMVQIHLMTRTRYEEYGYTSAWFRGLRMTCRTSKGADRSPE